MTLSLGTAYRSFGGEVEASSTPTICRLPDSRRHQLWAIAPMLMWWRTAVTLLPLRCGLPYALQRLCHALPSLCPVRALLARAPLGPRPWLHRLRCGRDRFVRRLHCYYGRV